MKITWNEDLETKQDYNNILAKLLQPFKEYILKKKKFSDLPGYYATSYSDKVIQFESFARMMWGYVFLGKNDEESDVLVEIILNGLNPNNDCYWGKITDYSQIIVEILPILIFCYQNIEKLIKKDETILKKIESWFGQINLVKVSNNNWQCFVILINLILKKMGLNYSEQKITESINNIEKMYLGNGWYSDGMNNQRDYYVSFAIHYYLLLSSFFSEDIKWNSKNKARAFEFSKSFIYWFSNDGAGLPFGRSLTYKFAQSAFWAIMIATNVDEKNNEVYKGILNRNIRWWLNQDIFDSNGFITLGYAYSNHNFTEYYNGTSSSYWCLKSFAILLLNANDNFFLIHEKNMPDLEEKKIINEAKMLLCRDNNDTFAFVNGQNSQNKFGHTECKYEKFVYSTLFPFCISKSYTSLETLACDSNLAISLNGYDFFARHDCYDFKIESEQISSTWNPLKGCIIKSIIIPNTPVHIRIHLIKTRYSIELYDFGYAVDANENCTLYNEKGIAKVINKKQNSQIKSILGSGEPLVVNCVPNTNSVYTRCKIPALHWHLKPGNYIIVNSILGSKEEKIQDEYLKQITFKDEKIYINDKVINLKNEHLKMKEPNIGIKRLKGIKRFIKRIINSV